MRRPKCTICGREVKLDQGRKLTVKQFKKNGDKEDTICNPCRTSFYNTNIQLKLTKTIPITVYHNDDEIQNQQFTQCMCCV